LEFPYPQEICFFFSESWIMMSSLLVGKVLSVITCWFRKMITSVSWLVSIDFGKSSYHYFLLIFTPISLHMLMCNSAHNLTMSPSTVFFPYCLALWYNEVYRLVTLLTKSAMAICFDFQYLLCNISFIMPGLVLPLLHVQLLLSVLVLTNKEVYFLH